MFELIEPTVTFSDGKPVLQPYENFAINQIASGRKITHEFKAGFGHAIVSGKQCATFYRPQPKKPVIPCPGDVLAPWIASAKGRGLVLPELLIIKVESLHFAPYDLDQVYVAGFPLSRKGLEVFAKECGFSTFNQMRLYIMDQYGTEPWNGAVVTWRKPIE